MLGGHIYIVGKCRLAAADLSLQDDYLKQKSEKMNKEGFDITKTEVDTRECSSCWFTFKLRYNQQRISKSAMVKKGGPVFCCKSRPPSSCLTPYYYSIFVAQNLEVLDESFSDSLN